MLLTLIVMAQINFMIYHRLFMCPPSQFSLDVLCPCLLLSFKVHVSQWHLFSYLFFLVEWKGERYSIFVLLSTPFHKNTKTNNSIVSFLSVCVRCPSVRLPSPFSRSRCLRKPLRELHSHLTQTPTWTQGWRDLKSKCSALSHSWLC